MATGTDAPGDTPLRSQIEIHTDPKAADYVIVRGAQRKTEVRARAAG
jgi:hypothetical protein